MATTGTRNFQMDEEFITEISGLRVLTFAFSILFFRFSAIMLIRSKITEIMVIESGVTATIHFSLCSL